MPTRHMVTRRQRRFEEERMRDRLRDLNMYEPDMRFEEMRDLIEAVNSESETDFAPHNGIHHSTMISSSHKPKGPIQFVVTAEVHHEMDWEPPPPSPSGSQPTAMEVGAVNNDRKRVADSDFGTIEECTEQKRSRPEEVAEQNCSRPEDLRPSLADSAMDVIEEVTEQNGSHPEDLRPPLADSAIDAIEEVTEQNGSRPEDLRPSLADSAIGAIEVTEQNGSRPEDLRPPLADSAFGTIEEGTEQNRSNSDDSSPSLADSGVHLNDVDSEDTGLVHLLEAIKSLEGAT